MGLDMYLSKRTYVGAKYQHNNVTGVIDIAKDGEKLNIKLEKTVWIQEELIYWRKANHIHKWFVENVQDSKDDCDEYYVSLESLEQLLKDCREVYHNKDKAEEVLPTQEGFFFGNTEYDQYYYQDIQYTLMELEKILPELREDKNYSTVFYQSSW